jgi:two-component system, cell cycle response regulator
LAGGSGATNGQEVVLREARLRFVAGFPKRSDSMELLLKAIRLNGIQGSVGPLREIAHQFVGMAGSVGFPSVSESASELEELAANADQGFDLDTAYTLLDTIRQSFAADIANPPSWAAAGSETQPSRVRVLVVDDSEEQRQLVADYLRVSSCDPTCLSSGDQVLDTVRANRPDVILLDANMPGLDGYGTCRALKADPDLSSIPVIFMTVRSSLDDKLAGLTLGADEYLIKPVEMRELVLRLQLLLRRPRPGARPEGEPQQQGQLVGYDAFISACRERLKTSAATLALIRASEKDADESLSAIRSMVRQQDMVSRYDATHIVMFLAGAPAALVRHRLSDLFERLRARGVRSIHAGLAFSAKPDDKPVETLLAESDDALAEARYVGEAAVIKTDRPRSGPAAPTAVTILLAEDDPEVTRIVDTQARAAGYKTVVAFDGEETLAAVAAQLPDVVVLDLMMPKLSGFDVLAKLQLMAERPRVIVLSVRGREDDVTRAFELGADDYVTKPFSPRELMARVARLLR